MCGLSKLFEFSNSNDFRFICFEFLLPFIVNTGRVCIVFGILGLLNIGIFIFYLMEKSYNNWEKIMAGKDI